MFSKTDSKEKCFDLKIDNALKVYNCQTESHILNSKRIVHHFIELPNHTVKEQNVFGEKSLSLSAGLHYSIGNQFILTILLW